MTLAVALAVYDEAALVALANKGTVRRAARDVEQGLVTLSAHQGEVVTVLADGETVHIDGRGPSAATCSCPAPGMCRHRIGAVLLLQRDLGGGAVEPAENRAESLTAEIVALSNEALRRFAGRASWRAAIEIAQAGADITAEGTALSIRLAADPMEIRYLPGLGPEGMISKATPARRKALHAAALIAVRRKAGIESDEPASEQAVNARPSIDPRFLAEVRAALAEACRSALSMAPLALEERLFTLSVSSRADSLPRLAALLRGIARMIRERRERSFRFDPDHCLGQIARADAICRALAGVTDPERRAALIGSVKQDYDEIGPLKLSGLGAEAWRAEGGGRGVTVFLYAAEPDRWFTASLARGAAQDPSFDPARAYRQEAIWGGTLAELVGADLLFDRVAASPQGRLSTGVSARPRVSPAAAFAFDDWRCAFSSWPTLGERLRLRLAGSLTRMAPMAEPVVLRPRRTMPPWFDDLAQTLVWPVEDANGAWLALSLAYDPNRVAHFDALQALFGSGFAGAVLASASIIGMSFVLRPIALLDGQGIRVLDLDPLPQPSGGRSVLRDGLRSLFARKPAGFARLPKSATAILLDETMSEFTGIAEMGCRSIDPAGGQRLARLAHRASEAGLETLATAINGVLGATDLPPAVLRGRYPVDQLRCQLVGLPMLTR